MKKTRVIFPLCGGLMIVLVNGLTGCATSSKPPRPTPSQTLPHQVREVDRNGLAFTNQVDRVNPVDAHSKLVISFTKPTEVTLEAGHTPGPEWKQLTATFDYLNQLGAEWTEINQRQIAPGDEAGKAKLREDATEMGKRGTQFVIELESKLHFTPAEARAILRGRSPGIKSPSANVYLNLAQWTTNNWERLRLAAEADEREVASNRQVHVTLQATRRSVTGEAAPLHVENWDNMTEGVYSPIDRTGLRPTEAEQKRLAAARQASEAVIALIHAAKTNYAEYKASLQKLASKFETEADALRENLETGLEAWEANPYSATTNQLYGIMATGTPAAHVPAKAIVTNLVAIHSDLMAIKTTIEAVRQFKGTLQNGAQSPIDLFWGSQGLINAATNLLDSAKQAKANIAAWPKRLEIIEQETPKLVSALNGAAFEAITNQTRQALKNLSASYPNEVTNLTVLWSLFTGSAGAGEAAAALAAANDQLISHTLDDLVDGRVNLKYGGLALDDIVTVRLRATNSLTRQILEDLNYEHEIGFMGWYGKPVVHLIFARAKSGPVEATQWKPNVAAGVEWHYQYRLTPEERETAVGKRIWNWLNPGAGLHVASLDQGPDSVEIGSGINLSFWDGLVAVGYGYNFAEVDDHQYFFVGLNLLSVFDKTKNGVFGR
jgi:hypothetical protein